MNKTSQHNILHRWLTDYAGIFYKLVRVYAFNQHDQEDLFQEVVLQVWQSIPNFNGTAKESTYVYQVALFALLVLYGVGIRMIIYGWRGSEIKLAFGVTCVILLFIIFKFNETKTHTPRLRNLEALRTKLLDF